MRNVMATSHVHFASCFSDRFFPNFSVKNKSNHYPNFILRTKSGNLVLLETKGDHLDGTDSRAKCRLGNHWEQVAGPGFNYFMVFESKPIEGAYTVTKAREMIGML